MWGHGGSVPVLCAEPLLKMMINQIFMGLGAEVGPARSARGLPQPGGTMRPIDRVSHGNPGRRRSELLYLTHCVVMLRRI